MLDGCETALLFGRVFFFKVFERILEAGKGGYWPREGRDVDFVDPSECLVSVFESKWETIFGCKSKRKAIERNDVWQQR